MSSTEQHTYTLSSRKKRIAAFLIDHVVMSFLLVSIFFLTLGPEFFEAEESEHTMLFIFLATLPGLILYLGKDMIKGISIGKAIMGIMVRPADDPDELPSPESLLIRNLFLFLWPIEFFVLAISEEKKRLGDKAVGTIVVDNPNAPKRLARILTVVIIIGSLYSSLPLFIKILLKNTDAYQVALWEIEQSKKIMEETGGIINYGMLPKGGVNISNGKGKATFIIKVIGHKKEMEVEVYLTKQPDEEWEVIELND